MLNRGWVGFAKTAGIVLVILVALTQLWDWTETLLQDDELVANVYFGPFLQLPQLSSEFERFSELRDPESLADLIDFDEFMGDNDDPKAKSLVRKVIRRVNLLLRERLPTSLPYKFRMNGVWRVIVTNESRRSLSEVTITLPDTRYLYVNRKGENPIQRESDEVIELGILRPQESVRLVSWASSRASKYGAAEIQLTHSEGVGEVVILVPLGPFAQWADRYWGVLLQLSVFLVLMGWWLNRLLAGQRLAEEMVASPAAEDQQQEGKLQPKTGEQPTAPPKRQNQTLPYR